MPRQLMCQLIGHPWELRLDRHKGIVHCPRCEESASLFGGRFVRHQIDALLATLQVRPDANECSGHEREEQAPDSEVVSL